MALLALSLAGEAQGAAGDPDESFDYAGPTFSAREVLFRDDGRILLVGQGYCRPAHNLKLMAVQVRANGELDPTFGRDGVYCDRSDHTETAFSDVLIDRKGRLLVSGKLYSGWAIDSLVLRLTPDGRPDTEFARKGRRIFDFGGSERAASVLQDGPGHLLIGINAIANREHYKLVRLDDDGRLDSTFGGDGVTKSPGAIGDFFRLATGKILVSANRPFRLTEEIELDRTYGSSGFGDRLPNNLLGGDDAVTPNGGIVWTGETWNSPGIKIAVVMWRPDGTLEQSFGEGGVVRTELGTPNPEPSSISSMQGSRAAAGGIAVQEDGRLVVTADAYYYGDPSCPEGEKGWRPVVLRYTADGELDPSFGDEGVSYPPFCQSYRRDEVRGIGIDPRNGDIIAQAASTLVRLLP